MDEFDTRVPTEDDFGGLMQKTQPNTTFIPKLDQK